MTFKFETSLPVQTGPAPDDFVLPKKFTKGKANRGPRFADDVWDLREFLPRTSRHTRVNFLLFEEGLQRHTAKEFAFALLRETPGSQLRPAKPTSLPQVLTTLARVWTHLRTVGVERLQDVRREHLEALLPLLRSSTPAGVEDQVNALKRLAEFGPYLSYDRLTLRPWPYRTARQISGATSDHENSTPRIPEEIMRPYLAAAVFYVRLASRDLLAAREELARTREATKAQPLPAPFGREGSQTRRKIEQFIERRRAEGRGLPALPIERHHTAPDAPVIDGIVQAPNLAMIKHLSGTRSIHHLRPLLVAAGNELGWEPGGLPTRALWPATGKPWRASLSATSMNTETVQLRVACWIVIAYLSGMRDMEIRELGRDCAFTELGADGRTRYKIRGRVYKNRKLSGDEANWMVLDIVHEAVEVLKLINDDPTHLFGYRQGSGYVLLSTMPLRLKNFRDHLNLLFSTPEGPYIPLPMAEEPELDTELVDDVDSDGDDEAMDEDPLAWSFDTRQFRRTLSWHIANQPFGVVAGTRQYKHASHVIFEGYAGTSASGFADEVAADKAVALLDYVEDLYHDWNEGGRSAGGAVKRVEAEFDRIRAELGDLPGVVASPERLRTMLRHLTRTLHPGALNDCFHHADTAVCGKRAKAVGRPLPMLNMCLTCPNSRRSSIHLPRYRMSRDLAGEELKDTEHLPPHQQTAIGEFIAMLDGAIEELKDEDGARV